MTLFAFDVVCTFDPFLFNPLRDSWPVAVYQG